MLSDRKLHANRLNAQQSTGPRTAEGKQRASLNSLKHGILAGEVVLPGESQADYDALRDSLLDSVRPRDAVEVVIVERMIAARWKLRRVADAERRRFENEAKVEIIAREAAYRRNLSWRDSEGDRDELLAQSHQREKSGWSAIPAGDMLEKHFDAWDELSKHEQRLENQFFKAMRELRQWRKARQDEESQNEPTENEPTEHDPLPTHTPASERSEDPDPAAGNTATLQDSSGEAQIENEPTDPRREVARNGTVWHRDEQSAQNEPNEGHK